MTVIEPGQLYSTYTWDDQLSFLLVTRVTDDYVDYVVWRAKEASGHVKSGPGVDYTDAFQRAVFDGRVVRMT